MERLTNFNKEIPSLISENERWWLDVFFKLKEYEDAEEQGLLVKVVHGEWIERRWVYECSVCGFTCDDIRYLEGVREANYCPNCGAKVDGKKEGVKNE